MHVPLFIYSMVIGIVTVLLVIAWMMIHPYKRGDDERAYGLTELTFGFILVNTIVVIIGLAGTFISGEQYANVWFDTIYVIALVLLVPFSIVFIVLDFKVARALRREEKARRRAHAAAIKAEAQAVTRAKATLKT